MFGFGKVIKTQAKLDKVIKKLSKGIEKGTPVSLKGCSFKDSPEFYVIGGDIPVSLEGVVIGDDVALIVKNVHSLAEVHLTVGKNVIVECYFGQDVVSEHQDISGITLGDTSMLEVYFNHMLNISDIKGSGSSIIKTVGASCYVSPSTIQGTNVLVVPA